MSITDIFNCVVGVIGLGTSVVAICISISTAKRQYKIELFNKRISYYYACDIICACCLTGLEDIVEKRFEIMGVDCNCYDVQGAAFLFEKEDADFISNIFSKWIVFRDAAYFLKNYNSDNDKEKEIYDEMKKLYEETKQFFCKSRENLTDKFEKYLKITK